MIYEIYVNGTFKEYGYQDDVMIAYAIYKNETVTVRKVSREVK